MPRQIPRMADSAAIGAARRAGPYLRARSAPDAIILQEGRDLHDRSAADAAAPGPGYTPGPALWPPLPPVSSPVAARPARAGAREASKGGAGSRETREDLAAGGGSGGGEFRGRQAAGGNTDLAASGGGGFRSRRRSKRMEALEELAFVHDRGTVASSPTPKPAMEPERGRSRQRRWPAAAETTEATAAAVEEVAGADADGRIGPLGAGSGGQALQRSVFRSSRAGVAVGASMQIDDVGRFGSGRSGWDSTAGGSMRGRGSRLAVSAATSGSDEPRATPGRRGLVAVSGLWGAVESGRWVSGGSWRLGAAGSGRWGGSGTFRYRGARRLSTGGSSGAGNARAGAENDAAE